MSKCDICGKPFELMDDYLHHNRSCSSKMAQGGIISGDNLQKVGDKSIETVVPLNADGMKVFVEALHGMRINTYNANSIKGRIFEYFNKQTEKGFE